MLEYIEEEYSSSFSEDEILDLLFYPSFKQKKSLNGQRLKRLGLQTYSKYNIPYEYDSPIKITPYAIIQLSKISSPWFFDSGVFILFDIKLYAKLKLYDDFKKFLDSIKD